MSYIIANFTKTLTMRDVGPPKGDVQWEIAQKSEHLVKKIFRWQNVLLNILNWKKHFLKVGSTTVSNMWLWRSAMYIKDNCIKSCCHVPWRNFYLRKNAFRCYKNSGKFVDLQLKRRHSRPSYKWEIVLYWIYVQYKMNDCRTTKYILFRLK